MKRRLSLITVALLWVGLMFNTSSKAQGNISTDNTSHYMGNDEWEWTVFITASSNLLNEIKCVQYTLHSTFPNPNREICERGKSTQAFPLTATGWGTFEIPIKVIFKDGRVQSLKHTLKFITPTVTQPLPIKVGNVATERRKGLWKWTVYIQGPAQALNKIKCVQYALHPTFPNPNREICARGKPTQAFPLTATGWGTFEIGVRVFLKNGQIQELKYQLKF
jgi:transcription initiation factor IIF auxiliary subunit